MLTLKQRLTALLREYRLSEILNELSVINLEMADDAAQDGRFAQERLYKNRAVHLEVDAKAYELEEVHKFERGE